MHRSLDELKIQSDPTMCFTRPRYQVSVYRTIGPLVTIYEHGGHIGYVTSIISTNLISMYLRAYMYTKFG